MIPIILTERTISESWDKEAQEHVRQVAESTFLVNPEQIVWASDLTDAPEKYACHVRLTGNWDLFVVESFLEIQSKLKQARDDARWHLEEAIKTGIVDSR